MEPPHLPTETLAASCARTGGKWFSPVPRITQMKPRARAIPPLRAFFGGINWTVAFGLLLVVGSIQEKPVVLSRELRPFHPRFGDRINADGTVSGAFRVNSGFVDSQRVRAHQTEAAPVRKCC
jgi:hypothetical protein